MGIIPKNAGRFGSPKEAEEVVWNIWAQIYFPALNVRSWAITAAADRQQWVGCRRARQTAIFTQH
ncbi:hypothetical protein EAH72_10905 [Pseudomonas caspiana]|nr:hypothetical protein EAH72_10905 [Pseudomonas caspiana]